MHTKPAVKCVWAHGGFGCWPFIGGGSVLVDSLFIVAHFVCGDFVLGPCFVIQYFVS